MRFIIFSGLVYGFFGQRAEVVFFDTERLMGVATIQIAPSYLGSAEKHSTLTTSENYSFKYIMQVHDFTPKM
jgi:hypothetical protein